MVCLTTLRTLRPGQNGRHFTDAILKCIFVTENVWISIKISLKFVPIRVHLIIFQLWFRPSDEATSHYLNQYWYSLLTHMRHSASMSWALCDWLCLVDLFLSSTLHSNTNRCILWLYVTKIKQVIFNYKSIHCFAMYRSLVKITIITEKCMAWCFIDLAVPVYLKINEM